MQSSRSTREASSRLPLRRSCANTPAKRRSAAGGAERGFQSKTRAVPQRRRSADAAPTRCVILRRAGVSAPLRPSVGSCRAAPTAGGKQPCRSSAGERSRAACPSVGSRRAACPLENVTAWFVHRRNVTASFVHPGGIFGPRRTEPEPEFSGWTGDEPEFPGRPQSEPRFSGWAQPEPELRPGTLDGRNPHPIFAPGFWMAGRRTQVSSRDVRWPKPEPGFRLGVLDGRNPNPSCVSGPLDGRNPGLVLWMAGMRTLVAPRGVRWRNLTESFGHR